MIIGVGKTTSQQQQSIHTGEAFEIWQHLVMRYDVYELTDIFQNFASVRGMAGSVGLIICVPITAAAAGLLMG